MSENPPPIPDKIREHFPHLQPLKGTPSLVTVNGIGLSVFGRRDFDPDTRTYIKTRCICLLYIPLFAVDAYRVADASSRTWFFFGKESLSNFARSWNLAVGCALLLLGVGIGWSVHTSSPEYRVQQEMKRAAALMQAGEPVKAAGIYRQQFTTPSGADAVKGFEQAVEACLQSDQSQTVATAFRLMSGLPENQRQSPPMVPDAFKRGLALVDKFRSRDPEGALDILDADAALKSESDVIQPLQIDLLKTAIAARADNTNRVVQLALIYESNQQLDESVKLLLPYREKLGTTEGSRILGQHLLEEGKYQEAYGFLFPYVQVRLDRLHAIEVSYSNTVAAASRRALEDLNSSHAPPGFYENYKAAAKAQQAEMVNDYIETRMRTDPAFQRALVELKEANRIVPVTLDLGIVQLNRAQELKDADARKQELEAAEKTFLAIRSFAGDTDEYRLFLGQVYYWLGKSKEGKEQFDQLLASRKRDYTILISLSQTLRSVGETADARALAEEAYQSAKPGNDKYEAASLRALNCTDEDDRIAWLGKSDPEDAWIQIELNSSRGRKALQQGNKTLAADFLRKAVNGYSTQPKTTSSLNNWALASFDLYEATGNVEDQKHGLALMEEAVALDPSDSILLHNTTYFLISRAVMDVNRDAINIAALGEQPGIQMLSVLYQNDQERAQVYQQLRQDEAMKKGLGYLDKALLLAPKNLALYDTALALQSSFRDLGELQKLQQRFRVAAPDLAETRQETLQSYTAAKDQESLDKYQARIQSLQNLARTPAISADPLTLEYVNTALNELQQNAWICGGEIDGQEMVRAALATYQKHHSSASRQSLQAAYFFVASVELAQQSPDFAALVRQTRHALAPEHLVDFVLERGGPLADLAGKNENAMKALALEKEIMESFPSWVNISEWAMLRTTDPEAAALVAKRFQENETVRLMNELNYQFNPWSASAVLEQYWIQKLLGDEKRAAEIYQNAVHDGVPLPAL